MNNALSAFFREAQTISVSDNEKADIRALLVQKLQRSYPVARFAYARVPAEVSCVR